MTDARLARIWNRALTRGTPDARLAQTSVRALVRLGITDATVAQLALRALVTLPRGVTVKAWTGAAYADAPAKTWDGSAYVDALGVKTWNGSTFA